jgi:hypothetical protein
MKKHFALGIAAAILGVSGVAAAMVTVDQITALGASESGASVNHDKLAANCWMVTGSANDASCSTSVAGLEVPAIPEIPNLTDGVDIPNATGLLAMASDAVNTATDAVASAPGMVGSAAADAQGAVAGATPTACGLSSLPVKLPVSAGLFQSGLSLFHMAQDLAMNKLGVASVQAPVQLPVTVPVSADDVINTIETETGCLSGSAGGSLPIGVPGICSATVPTNVANVIPSEVSGLLSSVAGELANLTGQGINVASNGTVGANCNIDGAMGEALPGLPAVPAIPAIPALPKAILPVLPAAPALPALPAAPLPAVPDVVGMVGGGVDTVTGTIVDSILGGNLPIDVPALPLPTSCSASGTASIGGLLGSLTSTITGGCK